MKIISKLPPVSLTRKIGDLSEILVLTILNHLVMVKGNKAPNFIIIVR